jgi:Inorganic pyrophosphatase
MNMDYVSIGRNPPEEVNAIIEVPIGGEPIKYEMDKKAGTLVVDRFLYTPMRYPGDYGFIPHTLSEDGDPCDILVVPADNSRRRRRGAADRRSQDDGRGGRSREDCCCADTEADATLRARDKLYRFAGNHLAADRALLRALQGP